MAESSDEFSMVKLNDITHRKCDDEDDDEYNMKVNYTTLDRKKNYRQVSSEQ